MDKSRQAIHDEAGATVATTVLEIRDLWVGDGPRAALRGIDAKLSAGEVLGILGPAAAGKSRLLGAVGLDFPPSRGSLLLRGHEIARADAEQRRLLRAGRIVLVHPAAALAGHDGPPGVTGEPMPGRTLPAPAISQRIQLAMALRSGADVVLLDEPLYGVGDEVGRRVVEFVRRLAGEVGAAVVVATRHIEVCELLADRVLMLERGRLAARPPAQALPLPVPAPAPAPARRRRWPVPQRRSA
ncbi:MAG: ATP-binding cassette domain-containing protein [Acidimicrobiales bacterium]